MLGWSLSAQCMLESGWPKNKQDVSNSIDILVLISELQGLFEYFDCVLQIILLIFIKIVEMVLGSPYIEIKSVGTKQTQLKANTNRGCLLGLASHIQSKISRLCGKWVWTITSPNASKGPPYWWFQCYLGWSKISYGMGYFQNRQVKQSINVLAHKIIKSKWATRATFVMSKL